MQRSHFDADQVNNPKKLRLSRGGLEEYKPRLEGRSPSSIPCAVFKGDHPENTIEAT
jgi:hypothetical protein